MSDRNTWSYLFSWQSRQRKRAISRLSFSICREQRRFMFVCVFVWVFLALNLLFWLCLLYTTTTKMVYFFLDIRHLYVQSTRMQNLHFWSLPVQEFFSTVVYSPLGFMQYISLSGPLYTQLHSSLLNPDVSWTAREEICSGCTCSIITQSILVVRKFVGERDLADGETDVVYR